MPGCESRDGDIARAFQCDPIYPEARPGANGSKVNFLLVPVPGAVGENAKVLIELYELPKTAGSLAALLNHFGDQAGPSGLMIRAEAGAVVSMKKFIKKNEVAPVRIALEYLGVSVYGTAA